jgi:hypothetical protein
MKSIIQKSKVFDITILSLLLLSLFMSGCIRTGIQVVPVSSNKVMILSAEDIVQIMQRTGFSNQQIIDYGPALQRSLASYGGAQITIRGKVEVMYAVQGEDIFISSLSRGSFIYNVKSGWLTPEQTQ